MRMMRFIGPSISFESAWVHRTDEGPLYTQGPQSSDATLIDSASSMTVHEIIQKHTNVRSGDEKDYGGLRTLAGCTGMMRHRIQLYGGKAIDAPGDHVLTACPFSREAAGRVAAIPKEHKSDNDELPEP